MRERRERDVAASDADRSGHDAAPTVRREWSVPAVLALQRAAGNRAVASAVASGPAGPRPVLQRCGGEQHAGCACLDEAAVQRTAVGRTTVQRDPPTPAPAADAPARDPGDLTGTPFAAFDPGLQTVLKDRARFTWTKPTLAETLGDLSNASVAVLARVGAMVSSTASFLWPLIASMGGGGWITDNFGMRVTWTDPGAVAALLRGRDDFCRDNPLTAKYYHGTTDAYRQIGAPGAATMHVVTSGATEIHIDVHQPVEGKEDFFLYKGQCKYDLRAWWDHAKDVTSGAGGSGARGTAVGRFASARGRVNDLRVADWHRPADDAQLNDANQHLETISLTVQKYAAMGKMINNEWEGDQQMLADAPTMAHLTQAESVLGQVESAQAERKPDEPMVP